MTLSCRAQAFSVDNLLRPSSNKVTESGGTTSPSPGARTCAPTYQDEFGKVQANCHKYAVNNDTDNRHVMTHDDGFPPSFLANSMFHKNLKHEFPVYLHKLSHTKPHLESDTRLCSDETTRHCLHVSFQRHARQDNDVCKLPLQTGHIHTEEKSRSSPHISKYIPCAPSGVSGSCFCHGEINFCHHPGVMSISDIHGSENYVIAELCHSDLWTSFHRLGTEMIITKSGRRMFPALKLRVTCLNPDKLYIVRLEFLQPDTRKYRYIYHSSRWMVSGSGDTLSTPQSHRTPEGPISGQAICSQIVSFERLKLTNTEPCRPGQASLVSMQMFQPQVVIQEVDEMGDTSRAEQYVIMFPQTSFIAVTAYQNQQITTLKIASNPFAKGFRESGKARLPYESFMTTIPTMISRSGALDYLSGLVKPPSWPRVQSFQRDFNLSIATRTLDRHSQLDSYKGPPVKVIKREAEVPTTKWRPLDKTKTSSFENPSLYTALTRTKTSSFENPSLYTALTRTKTCASENPSLYTALTKTPGTPSLLHDSLQQSHHQSCQIHLQQQKHHQQILFSGIPHHLHPQLHPMLYNPKLLNPSPTTERAKCEGQPQHTKEQSAGMTGAVPPPAHMPFHTMSGNRSKMSSKLLSSERLPSEDSPVCVSPRSANVELVSKSHCFAEQTFASCHSTSSHSSSAVSLTGMPEPATIATSDMCHCVGCG